MLKHPSKLETRITYAIGGRARADTRLLPVPMTTELWVTLAMSIGVLVILTIGAIGAIA